MPDSTPDVDGLAASLRDSTAPGTRTVEAYETDDGVVLHDAESPLAWVESETAVELVEAR